MHPSKILITATLSLCLSVASAAQAQDSFFDVFYDLMVAGEIDFESTATTTYGGFDTEIVSMNLRSSSNPNVSVKPQADGSFIVDSFFDVFYQAGPTGGPYTADSFFDVFTTIDVSPSSGSGNEYTFDTEILSMDLAAATGPNGPLVLGLADGRHRGHVTVLKWPDPGPSGGNVFIVDSFFDLFTEISLGDGGGFSPEFIGTRGAPVPADAPTPLEFHATVPEPTSLALLAGGLALSLLGTRRRKP